MKEDVQVILTLFENRDDYVCHLLLHNVCILDTFVNFSIKHIWRECNMYTDYVTSEGIRYEDSVES